jgi:hypothetical protein
MAVPAYDPEKHSMLAMIGRDFGCDWIRMIDPIHRLAQSRGEPDVRDNYTVKVGSIFCWREETRTKEFFCHEVEWSIGGQRFSAAVPMKLKSEWYGSGFFAHRRPVEDDAAMFDELISLIRKSSTLPVPDGPTCWL